MPEELDLARIEKTAKRYEKSSQIAALHAIAVLKSLHFLRLAEQKLPPDRRASDKAIAALLTELRQDWQKLRDAIRHG